MAQELLAAVEAFQLKDCWQWKPLLDGKKVMQVRSRPTPPVHNAVLHSCMLLPARVVRSFDGMQQLGGVVPRTLYSIGAAGDATNGCAAD